VWVARLRRGIAVKVAAGLLALGYAGAAFAADIPDAVPPAREPVRQLVFEPDALYHPERWEVRGGGFYHCCFVESGHTALGGEIVLPRLIAPPSWLHEFFIPRIHVGGVADLNGGTSYGFAGLLFTLNITNRIFAEPFVGIAVSDGVAAGDLKHNAIGCTTLIHSGGNIGYRFDEHWSVMATLDHISNGNICSRNVGVNNYGGKIGYSF
jgi:lipid A 3-O-deacylase